MDEKMIESERVETPNQLRRQVEARLNNRQVRSLKMYVEGRALGGAKDFGATLVALRQRGAVVTHKVEILVEFPNGISKEETLKLIEKLPTPVKGSLKVRLSF